MATKSTKRKAPRATPRENTKSVARTKKAPVDDGLSRAQIEAANAAGPGAVADLIRGGARKGAKAKVPAKGKATKTAATPETSTKVSAPAKSTTAPRERDQRLPKAGTVLTRVFGGKEIKVEVLDAGFRYDGRTWRSLSAIATAVSGTSWNGFLAFGLQTRTAKPAPATTAEAK